MKRTFFFITAIALLLIEESITLNNKNLCKKSKSDFVCDHPFYSFDCTATKCSTNEEKCSQYKSLQFAVRTFKSHRQQEINKFNDFEKNINKCPAWNKSPLHNICFKEVVCQGKKSLFYALFTKMNRHKICIPLCLGKLNYSCGHKDVCALKKEDCEWFQNYSDRNKNKPIHLKKCVH